MFSLGWSCSVVIAISFCQWLLSFTLFKIRGEEENVCVPTISVNLELSIKVNQFNFQLFPEILLAEMLVNSFAVAKYDEYFSFHILFFFFVAFDTEHSFLLRILRTLILSFFLAFSPASGFYFQSLFSVSPSASPSP